jgi:hypothetical protein
MLVHRDVDACYTSHSISPRAKTAPLLSNDENGQFYAQTNDKSMGQRRPGRPARPSALPLFVAGVGADDADHAAAADHFALAADLLYGCLYFHCITPG